jgi:hypothetical protein
MVLMMEGYMFGESTLVTSKESFRMAILELKQLLLIVKADI